MFYKDEGLNDRDEMLEELRSLFRFEEQLLKDGWYSEADFAEQVLQVARELVAEHSAE